MPTLFKRSNGIYYILYEYNGKRQWKSTGETSKQLAWKKLLTFESWLENHKPRVTYDKFVQDFLEYSKVTFAHKTHQLYEGALKRFGDSLRLKTLTSINARDADEFRARRATQVSAVSVNVDLRALKAAFFTAMRWNLIEKNPFKGAAMMRVPEQLPIFFSGTDFDRFLDAIDDQWFRDLVIVAVSTGMRRGEILALRWADVDFTRRLIFVHSSENFRTKAGKKRTIPMNETVEEVLRKRRAEAQEKVKLGVEKESVFNTEHLKDIGHVVTKKFKQYVLKAGLDPKLHFHSLRHTFATWLVQERVSIYEVQKLLGHSSISITQVYSHLASSELHDAVSKISVRTGE